MADNKDIVSPPPSEGVLKGGAEDRSGVRYSFQSMEGEEGAKDLPRLPPGPDLQGDVLFDEPSRLTSEDETVSQPPQDAFSLEPALQTRGPAEEIKEMLALLKEETRQTEDPYLAAALDYRAGQILERRLHSKNEALQMFMQAYQHRPDLPGITAALERHLGQSSQPALVVQALDSRIEATQDPEARAGLLVRKVMLQESRVPDAEARLKELKDSRTESVTDPLLLMTLLDLSPVEGLEAVGEILEELGRITLDSDLANHWTAMAGEMMDQEEGSDRTRQLFQRVLRSDPGHRLALEALCRDAAGRETWARLVDLELDLARREGAGGSSAFCLLVAGRMGLREGRESEGADLMLEALEALGGDRALLGALTMSLEAVGRLEEAAGTSMQHALQIKDPALKAALRVQAATLLERAQADPQSVIALLEGAMEGEAASRHAFWGIFLSRLRQGEVGQAAQLLEGQSLSLDEPLLASRLLVEAASLLVAAGGPEGVDRALGLLQRALELDPRDEAALGMAEELCCLTGQGERAARALYDSAMRADSNEVRLELLERTATLLEDQVRNLEAALSCYHQALEIDPLRPASLRGCARLLERLDRRTELAELLEREARMEEDPLRKAMLLQRAAGLWEMEPGGEARAGRSFEEILTLTPDWRPALWGLERATCRSGQWQRRAELLVKLSNAARTREELVALLWQLYSTYQLGLSDPLSAQDVLGQILEMDPGQVAAARFLAGQYLIQGDAERWLEAKAVESGAVEDDLVYRAAQHLMMGHVLADRLRRPEEARELYTLSREEYETCQVSSWSLLELALKGKDLVGAIEECGKLLGNVGDPAEEAVVLGCLARLWDHLLDNPERTMALYTSMGALTPQLLYPWLEMEELFLRRRDWERLPQLYQHLAMLLSDHPELMAAYMLDGAVLKGRQAGGPPEASLLRPLLSLMDHPMVLRRVESEVAQGLEPEAMAAAYGQLAVKAGTSLESLVYLTRQGQALLAAGRYQEAAPIFRHVLDKSERFWPAAQGLVDSLGPLGDIPALLEALNRLADLTIHPPTAAKILGRAGDFLEAWGLKDQARELRLRAIKRDPMGEEAYRRMRKELEQQGRWPEVVTLLDGRADQCKSDHTRAGLLLDKAWILGNRLGKTPQAKEAVKAAVLLDPQGLELLGRASKLLLDLGDREGWLEMQEQMLDLLSPEEKVVLGRRLAQAHADRGDRESALKHIRLVLEHQPRDSKALTLLADLMAGQERWQEALEALGRMVALAQDEAEQARLHLRMARMSWEGLKDLETSQRHLAMVLSLDPGNEEAGRAMSYLVSLLSPQAEPVGPETASLGYQAIWQQVDPDPFGPEPYHGLWRMALQRGDEEVQARVAGVLCFLRSAHPEAQAQWRRFLDRGLAAPVSSLTRADMESRMVHPRAHSALRQMASLLRPVIYRLFPPHLTSLGVVPGQGYSLAKRNATLMEICSRAALAFGVESYQVLVSTGLPLTLAVEHTDPPSLVVGHELVERVTARQLAFLIGTEMVRIRDGQVEGRRIGPGNLEALMGASIKLLYPTFALPPHLEADAASLVPRLAGAVDPGDRQAFTDGVNRLLRETHTLDLVSWAMAMDATAHRGALLLAEDLEAAAQVMLWQGDRPTRLRAQTPDQLREECSGASFALGDLMAFWASEECGALRGALGVS